MSQILKSVEILATHSDWQRVKQRLFFKLKQDLKQDFHSFFNYDKIDENWHVQIRK